MALSSSAVRMILRPMRPKPLMPTLMGITSSDGVSEIAALQERMTAAGEQKMLWVARTKVNARRIGGCATWKWYLVGFLFLCHSSERLYTFRLYALHKGEPL